MLNPINAMALIRRSSRVRSAAIMALTADLTREEHRIKAMALIGMSIGLSFALAMCWGRYLMNGSGCPVSSG